MKSIPVLTTAGIFLLLGTMVPVYAQRDGDKQGDSGKQEKGQPQHAQPQKQQQPQQQQKQPQRAQQPQQQQKQAQPQRAQQPQQQQKQAQPQQQQPQRAQQPQQQQKQAQPQQQQPQRAQQPPSGVPPQQQQPQRAQQPQQQQPQRAQQPQQQQPQRAQQNYRPPVQRSQEQARSWQQQKAWSRNGAWQGGSSWQQDRARNWASDHRTWAQRGGYGGFYIPQVTFGLYFGSRHYFRLHARPVMYLGYPRFEYGGYSFLLLDPWPEYWSDNWYDANDLYIDFDDYDGGYYLYNRTDPQVRLAVTIML